NWEPTQLRSLTILGGSGGNTINIVGTPAAAGLQEPTFYTGDGPDNVHVLAANGPFTLNTGAGNDTVELASQANTLAGIQSDLTVTGGAQSDTLTLNDSGSAADGAFVVTPTAVYRFGTFSVGYSGIESLVLQAGSGNDSAMVSGVAAGTALSLSGGGGSNTLYGANAPTYWQIPFFGTSTFNSAST